MQSKWLVKSATAIALVAVMAARNRQPGRRLTRECRASSQPSTRKSSTMSNWLVSSKSRC